jgi:hypothetical protein
MRKSPVYEGIKLRGTVTFGNTFHASLINMLFAVMTIKIRGIRSEIESRKLSVVKAKEIVFVFTYFTEY